MVTKLNTDFPDSFSATRQQNRPAAVTGRVVRILTIKEDGELLHVIIATFSEL